MAEIQLGQYLLTLTTPFDFHELAGVCQLPPAQHALLPALHRRGKNVSSAIVACDRGEPHVASGVCHVTAAVLHKHTPVNPTSVTVLPATTAEAFLVPLPDWHFLL